MTGLLIRFIVTFIAVFVAGYVLPPTWFRIDSIGAGVVFAAILAVLNAVVRPVVMLITCPIQILTLGLAALVINALLFLLAANITTGVYVGGFFSAIVSAIVVSLVSWGVSIVVRR